VIVRVAVARAVCQAPLGVAVNQRSGEHQETVIANREEAVNMKIRRSVIGVIATAACAVAAPAAASAATCDRGEVCLYPHLDLGGNPVDWVGSRTDIVHLSARGFRDQATSWLNRSSYRWCVYDVIGSQHILLWVMPPGTYDDYVGAARNDRADYARRGTC
jgi:hypothetical protein